MKANRNNKKVINAFIRQLNTALVCPAGMKKAFINSVKHQVAELENQIQVLTAEDLRREIGSPDEIARGFESRADLETLREKARKYRKTRMICWIALALTAAAIAAAIIVVKSNENYHSEIKSDSHIEEVES